MSAVMFQSATEVETLAAGWELEIEDVTVAGQIAEVLGMDLATFVYHIDGILKKADAMGVDDEHRSASHIMQCIASMMVEGS